LLGGQVRKRKPEIGAGVKTVFRLTGNLSAGIFNDSKDRGEVEGRSGSQKWSRARKVKTTSSLSVPGFPKKGGYCTIKKKAQNEKLKSANRVSTRRKEMQHRGDLTKMPVKQHKS